MAVMDDTMIIMNGAPASVFLGIGVIGGQAFYDNNNNGRRDDTDSNLGVSGINVWLFSCYPTSVALAYYKTSSNGIYRFTNLVGGMYYIVVQPPEGYEFSDVWVEKITPPKQSSLFVEGNNYIVESTVDPEKGRTICFDLKEGEKTMDWSFGLHMPSDQPSVQPSTSSLPTITQSNGPSLVSSHAPSMASNLPSHYPSEGPTVTRKPTTGYPTFMQSRRPSFITSSSALNESSNIVENRTASPTVTTSYPSKAPTVAMLQAPPVLPTPTTQPAHAPSLHPSISESTYQPSETPSMFMSSVPSWAPHDSELAYGSAYNDDTLYNGNVNEGDSNGISLWEIVGVMCGVIAILVFIAILSCAIIMYQKRRRLEHEMGVREDSVPMKFIQKRISSRNDFGQSATSLSQGISTISNPTLDAFREVLSQELKAVSNPTLQAAKDAIRSSNILSRCSTSSDSSASKDEEVPQSESHSVGGQQGSHSLFDSPFNALPVINESSEMLSPSHIPTDAREEDTDNLRYNKDIPSLISYSPDGSPEDPSFGSGISDDSPYLQSQTNAHSNVQLGPPASHLAAAEDERLIKSLDQELNALTTAIKSYPKESKMRLKLQSHIERVTEELDAVWQDIEVGRHTMQIEITVQSTRNLGLVVDKHGGGGPVYIRALHPLSPMQDKLKVNDMIISIDDEDVTQMSHLKVRKLLCKAARVNTKRKISIIREHGLLARHGTNHDIQSPLMRRMSSHISSSPMRLSFQSSANDMMEPKHNDTGSKYPEAEAEAEAAGVKLPCKSSMANCSTDNAVKSNIDGAPQTIEEELLSLLSRNSATNAKAARGPKVTQPETKFSPGPGKDDENNNKPDGQGMKQETISDLSPTKEDEENISINRIKVASLPFTDELTKRANSMEKSSLEEPSLEVLS